MNRQGFKLKISFNSLICLQNFKVVASMLELTNASFNFYMYCLCNKEIRCQAWNLLSLKCLRLHFKKSWQNRNKHGEISSEVPTKSSKVQRTISEVFPEVFNKKRRVSPF